MHLLRTALTLPDIWTTRSILAELRAPAELIAWASTRERATALEALGERGLEDALWVVHRRDLQCTSGRPLARTFCTWVALALAPPSREDEVRALLAGMGGKDDICGIASELASYVPAGLLQDRHALVAVSCAAGGDPCMGALFTLLPILRRHGMEAEAAAIFGDLLRDIPVLEYEEQTVARPETVAQPEEETVVLPWDLPDPRT